ncbi:hypothetical protein CpipJ_CPIJ018773 [Culex quinquefasciatus]|uniref:Uncharacterized protein n=1 Tax=Culex quinquefasciatus TaxID=7176 RepID=B0XHB1_CULQU|nr:hypothetical protein CpipJ_CPIJ018773 [Culex quinquefasciatus]|eukprot:XP_001869033.1 hypothetical protein CpipJ_CPIJ018773 [Culex quinquefasciatus]
MKLTALFLMMLIFILGFVQAIAQDSDSDSNED